MRLMPDIARTGGAAESREESATASYAPGQMKYSKYFHFISEVNQKYTKYFSVSVRARGVKLKPAMSFDLTRQ